MSADDKRKTARTSAIPRWHSTAWMAVQRNATHTCRQLSTTLRRWAMGWQCAGGMGLKRTNAVGLHMNATSHLNIEGFADVGNSRMGATHVQQMAGSDSIDIMQLQVSANTPTLALCESKANGPSALQ